ncbi:hypothetical protein [Pyxidicoccus xibeiensis]|uniref:hypothetical protein n=1 Tax=Pyxidicoccus xibeiensis TaxID=2906759 RepID=UPI0020A77F47|nr:hypothetical protein [Pyxidicoccus xibeiensis]MCP3135830.1 hypothetical protein [Pyxidicoccus xibeiensis]
MALNRPLLAVVGGALAVILASLGGVAYVTLRTGPLAERLVEDTRALARRRYPRPSHVTPTVSGTFAQQLAPLMDEVLRLYRERPEAFQPSASGFPCQGFIEGREPASAMPPVCREEWKKGRELLARVLAATHEEEGGLPEELGDLASPRHPYADTGKLALQYFMRLASLETRLLLEEGQAAKAVDTCVDTLALSRELSLGGGLIGQMVSVAGHGFMYRPCAAALDAAPLERKRAAVAQLSRLAEGWLPFSQVLRQEAVTMQLMLMGGLLSPEHLAALPAGARDVATQMPDVLPAPANPLVARLTWRKLVKGFDALVLVADLGPEARRREFEAYDARSTGGLFDIDGPSGASYARFAERVDLLRLQHDALITLAEVDLERAEKGRWPQGLQHRGTHSFLLEAVEPGAARLEPCVTELAEHALHLTADPPAGAWVRQP